MKLISLAGALVALSACASTCPDAPPQRTEAVYACDDGARLDVTFDRAAGRAFVAEDGGAALDLAVQISGVGYRYQGQGAELRGRGDNARWTSPAGATVACRLAG